MEHWVIILIAAVWWSIAIVTLVNVLDDYSRQKGPRKVFIMVTGCILWPIMVFFVLPLMLHQAFGYTTREIRNDLRSRGLLREFTKWKEEHK